MGVSTDAHISYGILFEEGFEFPWDDEKYDDGLSDWWRHVKGFDLFALSDEHHEYHNGITPPDDVIEAWFAARAAFDKDNPCPFEMVNACSGDYPIYILALKDPLWAWRGHPQSFNPAALIVTDTQRQSLIDFCKTYDIDTGDTEPKWYLSSYWG